MTERHERKAATHAGRPNVQLRTLMAEAGWSGSALARAVNECARENGYSACCDRTSVAHWLAGRRPRAPIPELVAEVCSRRLNRSVSIEATGLDGAIDLSRNTHMGMDVLDELEKLSECGVRGRSRLGSGTYRIAALDIPDWPDLAVSCRPHLPVAPAGVGSAKGTAAEAMVLLFRDADEAFGGGYARDSLAVYLAETVAPSLKAPLRPEPRRRLLDAATQLTYLYGSMCFDEELHARAQRYYRTALYLARENGNRVDGAMVLRALSIQAEWLEHFVPAVELAERAVAWAGTSAPPPIQILLLGQAATAAAGVGDRHGVQRSLASAQTLLPKGSQPSALLTPYQRALYAHHRARIHFHLSEPGAELRYLESSLQHLDANKRRDRSLLWSRLIELHLERGETERACSVCCDFLDDLPYLRSARVTGAWYRLRRRLVSLAPHSKDPTIGLLLRRAARIEHTGTQRSGTEGQRFLATS